VIDLNQFFIAYFLGNPIRRAGNRGLRAAASHLPTKFSTDRVDGSASRHAGRSAAARAGVGASRRVAKILALRPCRGGIGTRLLKP
jgi:hypothetical protein